MKNKTKTNEQLLKEIDLLKDKITKLKKSETKCKQTEQVLKESEQRYRLLAANTLDTIWTADLEFNMKYINDAVFNLLGYTPEEFLGLNPVSFMATEGILSIQKASETLLNRYEEGDVSKYTIEVPHIRKDGKIIDVEITGNLLIDSAGEVIGFQGRSIDITERKRLEKKNLETEIKLEAIFNHRFQLTGLLDINGKLLMANKSVCNMVGVDLSELTGKYLWQLPHWSHSKERQLEVQNAVQKVKKGNPISFETTHVNAKGDIKDMDFSLTPVHDDNGNLLYIIPEGKDITERKQAVEALKESEGKHRKLIETTSEGFWFISSEQKTIDVNQSLCDMLGYSIDEMIGKTPFDFVDEVNRKIFAEQILLSKSTKHRTYEVSLRKKNGTDFPTLFSATTFIDKDGNNAGAFAFVKDITERKQAEEKLSESKEKFRSLMEQSPVAIQIMTPDGRTVSVNKAFKKLWGFSEETLSQFYEKYNLLQDEQVRKLGIMPLIEKAFAGEVVILPSVEYNALKTMKILDFTKAKGKKSFIQVRLYPVKNETGEIMNVVLMMEDITERKQAEESLRRSEEIAHASLNATTEMVFMIDTEGILLNINKLAAQRFDKTQDELIGTNIFEYFPPDIAKSRKEYADKVRYSGKNIRFQDEREGRISDINICPTFDEQGNVDRFVVFVSDITESKQAEEALKSSEERLKILFESAPDAYYLSDLKGTFIDGNKAAEDLMGYKKEEMIGKSFLKLKLLPTKELLKASKLLVKNVQGKGTGPDEFMLNRKDGSQIPVEISTYPVQIKDKTVVLGIARDISERKKTEKELKKLSTAVKQSPSVITITDLKGNLEYVNPKFTELTGYTSKEAIGKNLRIIKSGKQPDELYIELWETISSGKVWRGEFHNKKKNGELFWEAASVSPIFDNLSKITNYIKVAEDITERKQAEEELQKSETRQALVLRSLPMAFYIAQPFGNYGGVWVSEQIGEISGFTTEQFMNDIHLWASRLHPEDRDRVLDEFDKVLEKEIIDIEYRWKAADGKYLWFLDSGVLIRDEKDRPIEIIGTWLDITERKQAEEALRASEDKYRTIFESSPEAIILFDKKGNVIDINDRIEDWLGYKPEDIIKKNLAVFPFMSNKSRGLSLKRFSLRMRGEEIPPFELEFTDKNGEKRIGLTTASLIKDEKGEIIQNLVMISDITERKQAEEELRKERVSLARRVEERTADLSMANAKLAKAAKMKDEFLASMSHELRTPLNAVLGLSEALQEEVYGEMNKKQHRSLRSIEESGRHLLDLINDILDIAKIEAGKVSLEINQVPIEVVCQASLRLVKQTALKKNLQLASSIKTSLLTFGADERRLKQILVNLLSNAVKFTPEGGEVGIEVTEDADKEKINFTVWDTGIGIAKKSMNKLFQSFVQIDSSLTREYSGTGLGLSLVKHLTELHGGCVTVESEPGEGSRFTITLPVETKTMASALKVEEGEDKPGKIETGKEQEVIVVKALILLAEDNEKNIEMLSDYLPAKGYNLVIARNGKEAVKVAKEQTPDLILMDIQMPVMDGLEATGIIRKNKDPKLARVPVIALTALAMPGDKEKCIAAGANDYIKKPVGVKYLVKKIEEILRT